MTTHNTPRVIPVSSPLTFTSIHEFGPEKFWDRDRDAMTWADGRAYTCAMHYPDRSKTVVHLGSYLGHQWPDMTPAEARALADALNAAADVAEADVWRDRPVGGAK